MSGSLEARLIIRPAETRRKEEIVAQGTFVNFGNETLTFDVSPLSLPSLALEIVDSAGFPVHLPPPPVPGGEAHPIELAPGQSYKVEYPGFVPQWTPPGNYKARLSYTYQPSTAAPGEWTGLVASEWVEFKILQ